MHRPLVLLAALSLAAACGGSAEPEAAAASGTAEGPASAQTFLIKGNDQDQFVPETVEAKVGTLTLSLQNGGVPHNLVFKDASLPGIPTISGSTKKSTTLTFAKAGTYTFECTIHPGMAGKVVVTG